jgi:hypothetical protein
MGHSGRKRKRHQKNRCKDDFQTCLQILGKTDERNPPFLGQFICLVRSLQTESLPQGHLARNMWQFGTLSALRPANHCGGTVFSFRRQMRFAEGEAHNNQTFAGITGSTGGSGSAGRSRWPLS